MVHLRLLWMLGSFGSILISSIFIVNKGEDGKDNLGCREFGLSVALAWQELDAKENTLI